MQNNNEQNEQNIGKAFVLFRYVSMLITYAILGGVIGYIANRTPKGALISAFAAVILRLIVRKITWSIIDFLVRKGK